MSTTSMAIFSNPVFATYSVYARNASYIFWQVSGDTLAPFDLVRRYDQIYHGNTCGEGRVLGVSHTPSWGDITLEALRRCQRASKVISPCIIFAVFDVSFRRYKL